MKESPAVSILIPNYNHGKYLSETIESVLNQSFQDFEVIIADNASTDNSREVIESYTRRDARITAVFHGSNLGPIPNWVSALQKASGHYCKILFSDDKLAPNYLEIAVAALGDDSVGFFYSAVQSFGDNDQQYFKFSQSGKFSSVAFLKGHLFYRKHLPVSPACALFRTSDVRRYLVPEINSASGIDPAKFGYGPDLLLFLEACFDYPTYAYDNRLLSYFRAHNSSITVTTQKSKAGNARHHLYYMLTKAWLLEKRAAPSDIVKRFNGVSWLLLRKFKGNQLGLKQVNQLYHQQEMGRFSILDIVAGALSITLLLVSRKLRRG